ncbi:unknown protein [Seminavis robusta]|uniref:Uncharacterized protein n=1 Tax=Seminavis robusta TaxID=568900 RepID=A0A9N8ELM0_9STRA|nr:unknown protein [Seminavis robusta]|eukprot:Sro1320_g262410.1 n/a (1167) ;mRNA; f:19212-23177
MVATRRSARRTKSSIELRNIFETGPVPPTEAESINNDSETTNNDSEIINNDSDSSDEGDFSETAFLSALEETIGCRPRKKTPIFEFICSGNATHSEGWLRAELMKTNPIKIADNEKRIMLFIFMSLSGGGWRPGMDGYSPTELLSIAWGVSKPAIRRACLASVDETFLPWITCTDSNDTESSASDEVNKKRPIQPGIPSEQSTTADADFAFSPALVNREPKRRDLKETPVVEDDDFASPISTLSLVASVSSPGSVVEVEDPALFSPRNETNRNDWRQHTHPHHHGTRLDFNRADKKDASAQTEDPVALLSNDDSILDASTQTDIAGRLAAEMQFDDARGLERLQRVVKWALPSSIGPTFMPPLLRKSIAKYSISTFDLKLGFELVSLEIGGSTRNQRCLHVWIRQPAVAVQRLVQSALVAGKLQDSFEFSNHRNELVVIQGSDRGGDITANLIRIGNRSSGNASQHCLPLSFYEFGKESYYNLQQTIFHQHKPTREFLQRLLEKEFHIVIVTICDNNNAVVDAQCTMLRFIFPGRISGGRRISLVRHNEDESASVVVADMREEREQPRPVCLIDPSEELQLEASHDLTCLSVQMIVSVDDENEIAYKGFALRNCFGRLLCVEFFPEDLLVGADNGTVSFECLQVRGFTSDDIKCNATLMGQGTASVMCPCTICIAPKKDFASYLLKPPQQQAPNREGNFANPKLYKAFLADAKGRAEWVRINSTGQAKLLKTKYRSVVYEPLLYTPPDLNTCSGMHVSSGLLTHCTVRVLEYLGEIDKLTNWLDHLRIQLNEAKQYMVAAKSTAEAFRKQDMQFVRDIKAARAMKSTQQVRQLEDEREKIAAMLMATTKARDSAKLFVEKGNEFLEGVAKKTKARIMGPATYCFRKAYEVDGRVAFRVENSGFELSNGDGIRVLERCDKVVERMGRVFQGNDNPQLQQPVDTLMAKYLAMAKLLYRMAVMMKSQRKWEAATCDEFEGAAQSYASLWLSFIGGDDADTSPAIFNKLHVLVSHIPQFARKHGMLGRCSEEGFESSHKCIESVRKPLSCMTSTEDRAHTIYRRIMLQSRPEIERTFESINNHFTKGKRGPYNKDPTKMKTADSTSAAKVFGCSPLPEGFVQSINGYVIKEAWKDYFEYVCFSKVPSSWTKVFSEDTSLGEGCRTKLEYI